MVLVAYSSSYDKVQFFQQLKDKVKTTPVSELELRLVISSSARLS